MRRTTLKCQYDTSGEKRRSVRKPRVRVTRAAIHTREKRTREIAKYIKNRGRIAMAQSARLDRLLISDDNLNIF